MSKNYGLGRGLASLIPQKKPTDAGNIIRPVLREKTEEAQNPANAVREISIGEITPNPQQPRFAFNEEKLKELSDSIKRHGVIQPLIVSRNENGYELIAGERRLQASKLAGLSKVPVIVKEAGEMEKLEWAIIENIQRHDLNPIEEAKAYRKLSDEFRISQEEAADKLGKSRSAVANKMRLLNLPVDIQRALVEGKINEGHAKVILAVTNPEKQRALYELILKNNLTVRQVEGKAKEVSVRSYRRNTAVDPEIKSLEDKLSGHLGTKVKIQKSGNDGGKIVVEYYSKEELSGITGKLMPV